MPEPERLDRSRTALIAYDVCRRALTPSPKPVGAPDIPTRPTLRIVHPPHEGEGRG